MLLCTEREEWLRGLEPQIQRAKPSAKDNYFQVFKPSGICLVGFLHFLGQVTFSLSNSSTLLDWKKRSYTLG